MTVLDKSDVSPLQSVRSNDQGFFYQLCKKNGIDVSVTNWTFGSHAFKDTFEECTVTSHGCQGRHHQDDLIDRDFDYVVLQQGTGAKDYTVEEFLDEIDGVMKVFTDVNPNTKFFFFVQSRAYLERYDSEGDEHYLWLSALKDLEDRGVTIVDWGQLVADIINNDVDVPGATENYSMTSFIVSRSAADGYHPNMLSGYITSLMLYSAMTGESAVGQDYSFCNDSSLNSKFNFQKFINTNYTADGKYGQDTNFPAIFASPDDMNGIQELIDQYIAAKKYRTYANTD